MKKLIFILVAIFGLSLTVSACSTHDGRIEESETEQPGESSGSDMDAGLTGKTLIVYYSFTNNSHVIAAELQKQTGADMLRVEPADENVNYNDYSIGLPMMNLIKAYPNDPASYPAIKTAADDLSDYDNVVIVAPLWWNNMAAPLQTFLFKYGAEMEGKRIGLIVSSGESSIEGVEADVKRLIPNGKHLNPSLWILRSRTNQCPALIEEWLATINKAQNKYRADSLHQI